VKDFYGRGATYPIQLGSRGGLRESANLDKIKESIRLILGTDWGQRVMRPTFGCNLKSLVFAPNNASTAALSRHYVEDGLKQWETRIDLQSVAVTNDNVNGRLLIEIRYRVKATLDLQSFVYPFYLEQPR
jgi:phage baseplate assembly protein W